MSLNSLPDDLIEHIARFLKPDDFHQFGMTQKRVHRILKTRFAGHKSCFELRAINHNGQLALYIFDNDNQINYIPNRNLGEGLLYKFFMGHVLSHFASIYYLEFFRELELDRGMFEDLLNAKTKIRHFDFGQDEILFDDSRLFIDVIKKYKVERLDEVKMPLSFYCEKVFGELFPHTSLIVNASGMSVPKETGWNFTDNFLMVLASENNQTKLSFGNFETNFTIGGIKLLMEGLAKRVNSEVDFNIGTIKKQQWPSLEAWELELTLSSLASCTVTKKNRCYTDREVYFVVLKVSSTCTHRVTFKICNKY